MKTIALTVLEINGFDHLMHALIKINNFIIERAKFDYLNYSTVLLALVEIFKKTVLFKSRTDKNLSNGILVCIISVVIELNE